MIQMSIFDITARKHGGNEQSVEARQRTNAAEGRRRILAYVQAKGAEGATSHEIVAALGIPLQTVSARCSELKAALKVTVRGSRKTITGSSAAVLVALEKPGSNWRDE